MKTKYWFIALIIIFIAIWFMPLPAYLLYSIAACCFVLMLLMINKAISFDERSMLYESYGEPALDVPADIDEAMDATPVIVAMKHDDDEDIDWPNVQP